MSKILQILHIEDNHDDAELIKSKLISGGISCSITCIENQTTFAEALKQNTFDLIISDYTLPFFDGLTALKMSHEQWPDIPFIFVSGTIGEESVIKSLTNGAANYVLKSKLSRLVPAVRRVLREAKERQSSKHEEERSRLVIESAPNAIVLADQNGEIVLVNSQAEKLFGYERAELIGQSVEIFVPERYRGKHPEYRMGFMSDPHNRRMGVGRDLYGRRKDGSEFPVERGLNPIKTSAGVMVLSAIVDITERKRNEQALMESNERFRQLEESIREVFWLRDPVKNTMLYLSPAYEAIWGRTLGTLYSSPQTWEEAIHPEDRHHVIQAMSTKQVDGTYNEEYRIVRPDGSIRWIHDRAFPIRNSGGNVYRIAGIAAEITKRKVAEQKLQESEVQFRLITENVADLIVVLDLGGKRLYNSPSYKNILGDPELLRGKDSFEEIHPDDRERIKGLFFETVKTGVGHRAEFRFITSDGSIRDIDSLGSVIRDDRGNVSKVLVVSRDVTEKKKLESQFLRTQRLESLGTLAGGIAHDLNNILSPILMALELLRKEIHTDQGMRVVNTLHSSAVRGADMVKQILTFARGVEGKRMILHAGHIINEIEKIIRETFTKSIRVRTSVTKNLWMITCDATQLHQVLLNLCVNARDAMLSGGTLTIEAENIVIDEQYARMTAESTAGPYVVISVGDTGTGIPEDIIRKMFDPFFTTKGIGEGTGLGLSTVHNIVKAHSGFINVYSEVGKGSRFRIYFPATDAVETKGSDNQKEEISSGHGETILIVDDEISIRVICKATLELSGYRVIPAGDGAEAIALYAQHKEEIALVLTDMMMPFLDGGGMIRAIRRLNPQIKVIATSGLTANEKIVEHGDLSVQAFINKPFTADKLIRTITDVLRLPVKSYVENQ